MRDGMLPEEELRIETCLSCKQQISQFFVFLATFLVLCDREFSLIASYKEAMHSALHYLVFCGLGLQNETFQLLGLN